MNRTEKYKKERDQIVSALQATSAIQSIQFHRDDVPRSLPAAIVSLVSETGTKGTSRQFVDISLAWHIFLIVDAAKDPDPDTTLVILKEAFRSQYMAITSRDLHFIDYYTSRIDAGRLVRIARIDTLRVPSGAAQ